MIEKFGMILIIFQTKNFGKLTWFKKRNWLNVCDCSSLVGNLIYNIHNDISISSILRDKSEPVKLLEKKFNESSITNS